MKKQGQEQQVPAVLKTFSILEFLLQNEDSTIKEISLECGISPASTTRILKTLTDLGYLKQVQNGTASTFSIGAKFIRFSEVAKSEIDLKAIAEPIMDRLSKKTSQTSQLAIIEGPFVYYILSKSNSAKINVVAPHNTPIPINVSACGKAIFANLTEEAKLEAIKTLELPSYTSNTITNKIEFLLSLSEVKKLGYATDKQEYAIGIGCLACPIFDHTGFPVAAIGITGQINNYENTDTFETIKREVSKAASDISAQLGFAN